MQKARIAVALCCVAMMLLAWAVVWQAHFIQRLTSDIRIPL